MNIIGKSECTASQMAQYLISKNPNAKSWALEYAQLYLEEGNVEGVRGDGAWIQSCKETGNFMFVGGTAVTFDQNNFCGLGVTNKGMKGHSFDTPRLGIRAQIQHLKGYATSTPLKNACIDPRYKYINPKGKAPTFEELAGKWAVPGYDTSKASSLEDAMNKKIGYGFDIVKGIETMKKINTTNNKEESKMSYSNSPLVTYKNISPNKTVNRNHSIDTITIHCIVGQWTAKQGCDYFAKSSSNASCNYVVGKDGSIGLCVEEKDRSWCSSNSANDHRAITIECASDTTHPYAVTDKALETLIKLCADICKRNGIKKLVWSENKNDRVNHLNGCNMTVHRDFKQKSCPGAYLYERHGYIANEVNKLLGVVSSNTSTPTPSSKTTVTYTTHRISTNSWGSEITGYNLENSMGYSGSFGKEIDKFTAKLSEGKITYTVHRDGKWGGEINGYSKTDTNNYAGSSNKPIDAIAIKAEGINGKLKYRVHRKTDNKWGGWITGYSKTDTNNYAGSFGKPIDAIQIGIE